MKAAIYPIRGVAKHKCGTCKVVSKYTGLLFFSNLDSEKLDRESVRYCPVCGDKVIPIP